MPQDAGHPAAKRQAVYSMRQFKVNLALQGGGALGAFTWGVLDRLSHEDAVQVSAISGASAGALNAAVYVSGLAKSGPSGARAGLRGFWQDIIAAETLAAFIWSPIQMSFQDSAFGQVLRDAAINQSRVLDVNPLRSLISNHVDFDAVTSRQAPRLFISATNVRSAEARIFTNKDLTADALLASACIPSMHRTVWIDEEPYWDGGLASNPPLTPLLRRRADRLLLVRLINSGRAKVPERRAQIDAYMTELLFSRPLDRELNLLRNSRTWSRKTDEIDLDDRGEGYDLLHSPSRKLATLLFEQGVDAGDNYFRRLRVPRKAA